MAHCSCPIYLTMSRTTNVMVWSQHFNFVSGRNVGLVYRIISVLQNRATLVQILKLDQVHLVILGNLVNCMVLAWH